MTYGSVLSSFCFSIFGNGFSEENLKLMRRFYAVCSRDKIGETVFTKFDKYPISSDGRRFFLSWAMYIKIMRVENIDERHFYEIEAYNNN